jgi:glycosyltransferase involved in cell wall biosynthesis
MLVIANHRPQKRLERLPTMVAELRSRGREARVLIVGEPVKADPAMVAIEPAVRAEAKRLGVTDHVELVGSTDDVAQLYASHDVVVSTSAFEGLSLVYLEALAAGLPIVTTAVAGTDELARKHPHAHVVALNARPATFGDAVIAAVDHAKTSTDLGLALDFSATKMAERHADLFARVLATRPARPRSGLVLVANNFSTGGAQSSARRLLVTLAAAGIPVRAIVLQEQVSFPTAGRAALSEAGIEVVVAPRAGDVDPIVTARAIAQTVDAWNPQALLFWNVISQHKVLIADLLFDTPIWDVSPGEMYFASFEKYLARPRVGSPYLTMQDYGRRLAGVIVKYEAERARAEAALGVRVDVVPNGVVVPATFTPRVPGAKTIVGTLARLGVDKKLEQLVDAVKHAHLSGRFDGCELRIAGAAETGDDAYEEALRARAAGLPITFVGEQEATWFLAQLDLFAMVSEPSGCPNASIEAMAAGLAVVATDVGGAREQIVHGETGLLVPRGDAAALGEAIGALAHDPARREALGRAAHARALARYDVKRMASDYARICLGNESITVSRTS